MVRLTIKDTASPLSKSEAQAFFKNGVHFTSVSDALKAEHGQMDGVNGVGLVSYDDMAASFGEDFARRFGAAGQIIAASVVSEEQMAQYGFAGPGHDFRGRGVLVDIDALKRVADKKFEIKG